MKNITDNKKLRIVRVGVRICFVVILIEIVILSKMVIDSNKGISDAIALATTVKPETFTELYFENHLNLPADIKPDKIEMFTFTIHNLEYQTMTYQYEVFIKDATSSARINIDFGEVTLKQDGYKSITETYNLKKEINRSMVVVNLINKKQQIDFWIGGTP